MSKISHKKSGNRRYRVSYRRVSRYAIALAALLAAAGIWSLRALFFDENFHTVIPSEVYRSAQPSPEALERRIKELGLRSVINLRGESKEPWFKAERAVTEAYGVDLHVMRLAGPLPPVAVFRQLVYLLDTARRPLLLHCMAGVDRSGFASAVAVLLSGEDVAKARGQVGLSYGSTRWRSRYLLETLADYEHWLTVRGWSHTPDRFRHWVENGYVPSFYLARLELLDVPSSIAKGNSMLLRFRATNMSPRPWRFRSDYNQGVHLGAKVRLLKSRVKHEIELRGAYRDLAVASGESAVLELEIPPLPEPGSYQFFIDLVDERVCWFSDMGSRPLIFELRVEAADRFSRKTVNPLQN